jgi:hypothetical protein
MGNACSKAGEERVKVFRTVWCTPIVQRRCAGAYLHCAGRRSRCTTTCCTAPAEVPPCQGAPRRSPR